MIHKTEIIIPIEANVNLTGDLNLPKNAETLVIFSHGSGSSRLSPRNRHVSDLLNKEGFATLLIDLLTREEDNLIENRFNINLLTDRLVYVTRYMLQMQGFENMRIGYFGASTGAASALKAAAEMGGMIKAVVSRGGRPDLASIALQKAKAPTLLIVGSLDIEVLGLNEVAYSQLHCTKKLEIVEGASHLFEEPGKLDIVADLASNWFKKYLQKNHAHSHSYL